MSVKVSRISFASTACVGICSVSAEDRKHPNKLPFTGTLLVVDEPSNKPPHGSEGHRILVPMAVAKKRLSTLIGTGLNYKRSLDGHAPTHKIGVITGAWIKGKNVNVKGFIWKRDFPSVERDLSGGKLGMSMELADCTIRSKSDDTWILEDFHFTGATVLFKSAAAYFATALAAAAARVGLGGKGMIKKKKVEAAADGGNQSKLLVSAIAAGVGPALKAALDESLAPLVAAVTKSNVRIGRMAASMDEFKILQLEAAKDTEEEEETETEDIEAEGDELEAEGDEVEADADDDDDEQDSKKKGKKKAEEDDDDEDEDGELEAEMEKLEDDPAEEESGELNKDAENMGDKTHRKGKVGKAKKMKELVKASSTIRASSLIRELYASHRASKKKFRTFRAKADEKIEGLENKVEALEAQVEQYAERVDRKSISPELSNFLAKNNVDVRELQAEGRKMSVNEIDQIFANSPVALDPTTRMWFKNQLLERDLMEQGEINRHAN